MTLTFINSLRLMVVRSGAEGGDWAESGALASMIMATIKPAYIAHFTKSPLICPNEGASDGYSMMMIGKRENYQVWFASVKPILSMAGVVMASEISANESRFAVNAPEADRPRSRGGRPAHGAGLLSGGGTCVFF